MFKEFKERIQINILVSASFVDFSSVDPSVVLAADASFVITETETQTTRNMQSNNGGFILIPCKPHKRWRRSTWPSLSPMKLEISPPRPRRVWESPSPPAGIEQEDLTDLIENRKTKSVFCGVLVFSSLLVLNTLMEVRSRGKNVLWP